MQWSNVFHDIKMVVVGIILLYIAVGKIVLCSHRKVPMVLWEIIFFVL